MDFWTNIFTEINGDSVLELACGTGRIARTLIREGAEYTGIELSRSFVSFAKNSLKKYNRSVSIICSDMRNFNLNKKFDLIFIGFNSFLHLLNDKDAINCLNCVKKHMHKTTRFIIDIYIPNPLFLYRPIGVRFKLLEYINSINGSCIFVEESNNYDISTEINHLTWYFSSESKLDFAKEQFSVRMYFPSKMNQLLIDCGFCILNQWGDYYKTTLGSGSKLQIYNLCLA